MSREYESESESSTTPEGMSAEVAAAGGTPFNGYAEGFSSRYQPARRREGACSLRRFSIASPVDPEMRVRFTLAAPEGFPR